MSGFIHDKGTIAQITDDCHGIVDNDSVCVPIASPPRITYILYKSFKTTLRLKFNNLIYFPYDRTVVEIPLKKRVAIRSCFISPTNRRLDSFERLYCSTLLHMFTHGFEGGICGAERRRLFLNVLVRCHGRVLDVGRNTCGTSISISTIPKSSPWTTLSNILFSHIFPVCLLRTLVISNLCRHICVGFRYNTVESDDRHLSHVSL